MFGQSRHLMNMLTRRQIGGLFGGAAVLSWLPVARADAGSHTLFDIARSTNQNVVRYAARLYRRDLDSTRPVEAYWVMRAEDGRREELSWAERKLAYGFAATEVARDHCQLRLVAFKQRAATVERTTEAFRALLNIGGRRAVLERIFVQVSEGAILPSVQHVDLYGTTLDGAPISERIRA